MIADRRRLPRSRTLSGPSMTNTFGETLRAISKEAQSSEFADVFDAFFFSDKRCQNRAFFMAARLKQTLQSNLNMPTPRPSSSTPSSHRYSRTVSSIYSTSRQHDELWEAITHRLYTLNYLLFVLPSTCELRSRFLSVLEAQLAQLVDGQEIFRRGAMEAHFVVRYVLKRYWQPRQRRRTLIHSYDDEEEVEDLVERAREVLEHCLESESKLGHAERDAMYVFHGLRMGLHGSFEPQILLDEDPELAARLRQAVEENKQLSKPAYVNPFEDVDAIVKDEEDIPTREEEHEADSGFYDHFVPLTPDKLTTAAIHQHE